MKKFNLGEIVITPAALSYIHDSAGVLLERHASGDWGTMDPDDCEEMDHSLANGNDQLLMSTFHVDGTEVWVITEHDRSVTTILLPSDY